MSGITTDPNDPRLGHGADDAPVKQNEVYLVLPREEVGKGFLRPYCDTYRHLMCGTTTKMGRALSETYARDPWFYGSTYCVTCSMHRPLREFVWVGGPGDSLDPCRWTTEEVERVVALREAQKGAAPSEVER